MVLEGIGAGKSIWCLDHIFNSESSPSETSYGGINKENGMMVLHSATVCVWVESSVFMGVKAFGKELVPTICLFRTEHWWRSEHGPAASSGILTLQAVPITYVALLLSQGKYGN